MRQLYKNNIFEKYVVVLVVSLTCLSMNAQNLIKNPSFEDFKICPEEYGCLEKTVVSWYQPTYGSTDYFNSCSPSMSSEDNFIGVQSPFEGHGYAGLYAYAPQDYREYLTAELKAPLQRGQKYVFSFQISLAEESHYAVNEFGILFTNKSLDYHTKRNIPVNLMTRKKFYNYTIVRDHKYYANKREWVEVSGVYIADGTEGFMTIGNFKDNKGTHLKEDGANSKKVAYYYVDMVSVTTVKKSYKPDEVYVFENLSFDVDGFSIEKKGKNQLTELVNYLKVHRGYNISVYGHTDDKGSEAYNKELSKKRAKAVADFLVANGLQPHRIVWRGYGDLNPLVKNETTQSRGKNRRVEFVLSRKKKDYYASGVFEDDK